LKLTTGELSSKGTRGLTVGLVVVVTGFLFAGCSSQAASTTTTSRPVTSTTSPPGPPLTAKAAVPLVASVLNAEDARLDQEYAAGLVALGSTQYPDASAGLQALSQAGSDAANWSAWQRAYHPESNATASAAYARMNDILNRVWTTDSCSAACDATSTAEASWLSDAGDLEGDIDAWTSDATSWQISQLSAATLTQDENGISTLMKQLATDVRHVTAAM